MLVYFLMLICFLFIFNCHALNDVDGGSVLQISIRLPTHIWKITRWYLLQVSYVCQPWYIRRGEGPQVVLPLPRKSQLWKVRNHAETAVLHGRATETDAWAAATKRVSTRQRSAKQQRSVDGGGTSVPTTCYTEQLPSGGGDGAGDL